jgi:hypothetical protein
MTTSLHHTGTDNTLWLPVPAARMPPVHRVAESKPLPNVWFYRRFRAIHHGRPQGGAPANGVDAPETSR